MANYDIIEADGQTVKLSDGQVYENKLIDLSTGKSFQINARNRTNWTIRNIGFKGYYEGAGKVIAMSDDSGGSSLIENVYMGDGASKSGSDFVHGPGAIFLGVENTGQITIRNCNVQGWPDNGFYCSAGYGPVRIEDCFAANNGISNYRTGIGGDEIVNCVGYNDTTDYGWYHEQNNYVEENGRNVWAWVGTVDITDSHFARGPYPNTLVTHNGGTINFNSGTWDGGPVRTRSGGSVNVDASVSTPATLTMPSGVPTSAEEAAGDNPIDPDPIDPTTPPGTDHDYETIVANDQTIYIDDNEVYQNKLFDCTNGKTVRLYAVGVEGWHIRNIGWEGQPEDVGEYQNIRVAVPEDGTGHIENVYMPGVDGTDSLYSGITIAPEHSGTLNIRRFYGEEFTNFGINASRHGRAGTSGTVNVARSYLKDVDGAAVGLSGGGDVVSDTTVHLTTAGAPKSGYGIYADAIGPVSVDNCVLSMNGLNYALVAGAHNRSSEMTVTNTAYDNTHFGGVLERYGSTITLGSGNTTNPPSSPQPHMLIPTSAEDAAGGDPIVTGDPPISPPTPAHRLEYPGAIAVVSAEFPNGVIPIPLYDPDDVEWAATKVQLSDPDDDPDDIGAFAIAPRADAAFPGISIETAGGIFSPTHLGAPRRVPIPEGDGDGGGGVPDPGSDPDSLLIDDFDTGISGTWTNSADWESSGVEAFRGGRAARRYEFGLALQAGPGQFDEWFRKGGPFIRFATRANTSADNTKTQFAFARSEIPHESTKWGLQVDWDSGSIDINAVDEQGTGSLVASDPVDTPGLDRREWYDCVAHWGDDDTIRFWLYASDGTELAYAEHDGDGRTGDYFAINTTRPTNIYVDEVAFYENHPHTGEASGATIGDGAYTEPQTRLVDDFQYADGTELAATYDGNLSKFEVAPTPGATADNSVRLRTERHAGGDIYSLPGDGLPHYPEEGDTITWRFRANRSSETAEGLIRHRLRFGLTEAGEYFDATLNIPARRYFLAEKTEPIDRTPFSDSAPSAHIPANRWIRGEIEWRTNRIRLRYVDDVTNEVLAPWIEGTPQHHDATDGGIAVVHYAVDATEEVYTDSITLSPEDTP